MTVVFNQSGQRTGMSITSVGGHTTIVRGDGTVIVDGKVVSEGVPLPEVHEEWDGITAIEIDGFEVSVQPGLKFRADGTGSVRKVGNMAVVSEFNGSLVVPAIVQMSITVNSGSVSGAIGVVQNVNLKSNSGTIRLKVTDHSKPVNIEAKANSGDISINL